MRIRIPTLIRIIKFFCLASVDDLLSLAHDLADRLLPAFGGTATGVPFPRHVPTSSVLA
jgi:hypothetical protein